ncbi:MAG: Holliday junction resolvase [Thermoplasmatota archaeon]
MGSANDFERELKGILSGNEEWIRRTTKTASPEEVKHYRLATVRPFLVVRGAGSLGVDLVALRNDISFPIEVKSSGEAVLRFSSAGGANQEQAQAMAYDCARSGVIPLYAYRRKGVGGDAWRIFTLPALGLQGRAALLYEQLPKPRSGTSGAFILEWQAGMPLAKFLNLLCAPREAGVATTAPEPAQAPVAATTEAVPTLGG